MGLAGSGRDRKVGSWVAGLRLGILWGMLRAAGMSAERSIGFALRTVNERVQQSVARRPRVRAGLREPGRVKTGTPAWAGCHGDAEGAPGGAGLRGLARLP